MKTIIAPTDFTPIAENACLYAAKLAADLNAKLILFHTIELPLTVAEYPISDEFFDEEGVERELESLRNKLQAATGNKISIKTRNVMGTVEFEIKNLCNKIRPFAVVLSPQNSNVLRLLFPGSTTLYSAKHLCFPVIVVPHDVSYKPVKKMALTSDLKNISEVPVSEIEMIAKTFNAKLEIFYVGKNEEDIDQHAGSAKLLTKSLKELHPEIFFGQNEDVWKGVSVLAGEHATDMVLIIPKKHGPFHKSESKNFVFRLNIPVMAIHLNDKPAS